MSIPVDVADLARALKDFGAGYLLTSRDGRVKVVTVEPSVTDGLVLVAAPGKGTLANVADNAAVTLVFPPPEPKGFTLLVDGTAEVAGDDVRVAPSGAVLHRPASHADGPLPPDGCGHDCAPVGG
ncbi:MAG TPA: pyridoxamine 5'-phosphate oxidase family protein [Nocardioides sp.]|uniref:pyridoxamine 5'-phosphate oxidase family protein n=1 Tax=uncultured Nocardioides sp. TaxID=198441 RepID=UPI000EE494E8|nr:pyridoxamine 5'-phosphate oxidase family protein [uncultured Nocardioides sp.]HCB03352.1 pyridoxamine 5'-phosphate oxidase [Nocardioides sp.]HRD59928.1 pyridoxamine 5'-phosphate oxidase family protein [Nocardioides sp.]HRI97610.1 pyridoxamine 5'-phosphate oxidase family protein [Nocardioides sp.]HRK47222.1 pyridoxamine 5'-phosphate oxidase family protein [Nocardioides sp.]